MTPTETQAIYAIGIAQALHEREETARKATLAIRDANRLQDQRDLFRQLCSEALALLDENDPDHEAIDLRSWLKTAKTAIQRGI